MNHLCACYVLALMFFTSPAAFAQTHEIGIGMGKESTDDMFDGNKPAGVSTISYTPDYKRLRTYAVTYRYTPKEKWSFGGAIAYENRRGTWGNQSGSRSTFRIEPAGTYERKVYTVAPEVSLTYAQAGTWLRLYGSLGLGVSYQHEMLTYSDAFYNRHYRNGANTLGPDKVNDNSRVHANFHLSAIGLRVGDLVSAFAELGMGYKGAFQVGLMAVL